MQMVETYKALADESRLRLVSALSRGYFNVQELTSVLKLSQSTISHHLAVLQRAGIAKNHKEGTWVYYSLAEASDSSPAALVVRNFLELAAKNNMNGLGREFTTDTKTIEMILGKRRDVSHRYFESVASNWKELRHGAQGDDAAVQDVLRAVSPDSTLLEIGCGTGALLERLLPRPGVTIGVDYSQAMLDEARAALAKKNCSADLRLGHLEHLPLGDESVDAVVAYMVLHHVSDPRIALKDAARVLRPGGTLTVVDLMKHQNEFMRERYADLWLGFDLKEFKKWTSGCGFGSISTKHFGNQDEIFLLTCKKDD